MENIHGDVVSPNSPNRRDLSPRLLTNAVKLLELHLHEAPQKAPCERQTGAGEELNTTTVFLSISRGRGEADRGNRNLLAQQKKVQLSLKSSGWTEHSCAEHQVREEGAESKGSLGSGTLTSSLTVSSSSPPAT